MSKFGIEGLVGEVTQRVPEGRANSHRAFPGASESEPQLTVVRATKRKGGCKTCEGRGCNGHCKF